MTASSAISVPVGWALSGWPRTRSCTGATANARIMTAEPSDRGWASALNSRALRWVARHSLIAWLLLATAGPVALYSSWGFVRSTRPGGIRVVFDDYDIGVYHRATRWVVGEGTLYRDVFSEYPLAANLIFAAVRVTGDRLSLFRDSLENFYWLWMSLAWVVYVGVLQRVAKEYDWRTVLLWLNPGVLYFTLTRFDIYPVALTLLWLLAVRRNKLLVASGWLGLAIAVKGYPLFLAQVFLAYVWLTDTFRRALLVCVVCLTPFLIANTAVYGLAGYRGLVSPYRFHAERKLDSQSSTYDAAYYAFRSKWVKEIVNRPDLARAGQVSMALLAVPLFLARKTDPFVRMVEAGLVALIGLLSFSLFYSPQFVVWLVPLVACSGSPSLRVVTHAYLLSSLLYFPVFFDLRMGNPFEPRWNDLFRLAVMMVTGSRLAMLTVTLTQLLRFPRFMAR
jgi:Glycosyltransferase family 87